jgi:hypothetical protein
MKKASNFTLWNGKLYLVTNKDKKAPIYKEVPELQLRLKIIDNAHKKGHFSIRSTMEKIRANYWWPNITIDLKKHISTCKQCQIFKPNRAFNKILTDQGKAFVQGMFSRLVELEGITHLKTAPYTPSTNGQTERFNQTLCRSLAKKWLTKIMMSGTDILIVPYLNTDLNKKNKPLH